jgi:hypothetical protein
MKNENLNSEDDALSSAHVAANNLEQEIQGLSEPQSSASVTVSSEAVSYILPPAVAEAVSSGDFLNWALNLSFSFLDIADLPPLQTVDSLRSHKEDKIREKIHIANSILVLLAHYGSKEDNQELVSECESYALKMKTIIKRLCL